MRHCLHCHRSRRLAGLSHIRNQNDTTSGFEMSFFLGRIPALLVPGVPTKTGLKFRFMRVRIGTPAQTPRKPRSTHLRLELWALSAVAAAAAAAAAAFMCCVLVLIPPPLPLPPNLRTHQHVHREFPQGTLHMAPILAPPRTLGRMILSRVCVLFTVFYSFPVRRRIIVTPWCSQGCLCARQHLH